MIKELTEKLIRKENLTFVEAQGVLNSILDGQCHEIAIAGFLTALAAKGETAVEMAGMARAMRDHAVPVRPQVGPLVDIVGTGGDGSSTFNISTTAALVAAGAGAYLAKHGNRAITSKCGSADLLAALGVKIDAAPAVVERCIEQAHIGFMFAPSHHPAMKYVQPIRKALGFRTAFNVLGPLANPANVPLQIIGAARPYLLPVMIEALQLLGVRRAMVVHSEGTDEFTNCGPTDIMELREGQISRHTVDYSDYGLPHATLEDLRGGSLEDNVTITRGILAGTVQGPRRDVVLLNAAAVLMVAGMAAGFIEGIALARESIDVGKAQATLEKLVHTSQG